MGEEDQRQAPVLRRLVDTDGAYDKYLDGKDYWQAGRTPPGKTTTVADILDGFLGDKNRLLDNAEINARTHREYEAVCDVIAETLGKTTPVDLISFDDLSNLRAVLGKGKSGKKISPITHKRLLTFARMAFNHAN